MNVSQLTPLPAKRITFTLESVKQLPAASGCYVLTNFQGEILYVGLTVNLFQRFKQHRDTPEKCLPTALGRAHWFYYITADVKEINAIERGWQNQYSAVHGARTVLNKIDSPVR
jgi:excinuclease UvrABC nuclease subunit